MAEAESEKQLANIVFISIPEDLQRTVGDFTIDFASGPVGPIVPMEAMAMERPIVVTDSGGNSEEVLDGKSGIVVPVGNAWAMSEAILKLVRNNDMAKNLGAFGRQRVLQLFTNKIYANNIQQVYNSIIN